MSLADWKARSALIATGALVAWLVIGWLDAFLRLALAECGWR